MKLARILLGLVAAGVLAQASFAQLGKIWEKAKKAAGVYTPWNADQEQAIGAASAAKLINIFGLYENAEMTKYVNLVGNAMVRQADRSVGYHFAILDTDVVTAVSLPGGYIFITRGALVNLRNEAELAGVLAHEVAHVDQRHLEKEVRARKTTQFAKEEAASRVPSGAELINLAGDVVTETLTLQVSRGKETEADRLGLDLASKAGYDAAGLRNFLQLLAGLPATPDTKRALGLWGSNHPPISERVSTLTALLANYPSNGQQLAERFGSYVNPLAFARGGPAAGAANTEVDGIVSQGVVVLVGGKLPEGTRVKVRPQP